jgi:hypothetical protein
MDRLDLAVFPSKQTSILPLIMVFCEEGRSVGSNSGGRDISTKRSGPMKIASKLVTVSFVTGLAMLSTIQAQEKKIKREDLPTTVQKTVGEQSKGGTIRGFSTEIDKGETIYEAELSVNGHKKDISMDEQGNIVEVEEEVSINSLPPAVKDGLTRAAGSGTIGKVESLTKAGKLVAYEAVVKTGTKSSEIQVGPEGRKLAHPE